MRHTHKIAPRAVVTSGSSPQTKKTPKNVATKNLSPEVQQARQKLKAQGQDTPKALVISSGDYCKLYPPGTTPYISTIEAMASKLAQHVFFANITPPYQAYMPPTKNGKPYALSKAIEFQAADSLSDSTLNFLATNKKRQLAALSVKNLLAFRDPDKHMLNWGIMTGTGDIVEIDHDRAFGELPAKYQPDADFTQPSTEEDRIDRHPNLIHSIEEMFLVFDETTIQTFPNNDDLRPYNHPLKQSNNTDLFEGFKALAADPEFIQWKYYYLTKTVLMADEAVVDQLIEENSVGTTADDAALKKAILEPIQDLMNVLVYDRHYLAFLTTQMTHLEPALTAEISESNALRTTHPSLTDIDKLKLKLHELKETVTATIAQDTPQKKARRHYYGQMQRIMREQQVVLRLNWAIKRQQELQQTLHDFINKHASAGTLTEGHPDAKAISTRLFRLLESYQVPVSVVNVFFKKKNWPLHSLFTHLQKHASQYLSRLSTRLTASHQYIDHHIKLLVTNYAVHCPEKDLRHFLDILRALPPKEAVAHFCSLLNRLPFTCWPVSFLMLAGDKNHSWQPQLKLHAEKYKTSHFRDGFLFVSALTATNSNALKAGFFKAHQVVAQNKLWQHLTQPEVQATIFTKEEWAHVKTIATKASNFFTIAPASQKESDDDTTDTSTFLVCLSRVDNQFVLSYKIISSTAPTMAAAPAHSNNT